MERKGRGILKYIFIGAVVLLCVFIFVFFGSRDSLYGKNEPAATSEPSATAEPKGIPLAAFISALDGSGLALGEPERTSSDMLTYTVKMSNPADSAGIRLTTDKLGRVLSYELRIGYMYVEGAEDMQDRAAYEAIMREYKRRIALDEQIISAQLGAILDLCASSCGIGSADRQKLCSAVIDAYESGKEHDKKFGALRECSVTSRGPQDSEFLLELIFDLSKMK